MTHEELARPQVITVVEDLAEREATGILEVTGSPSGAIYLDGGRVVFAKAAWVPGLAARLRGRRPPLPGRRQPPPEPEADDAAAVAELALHRGDLTAAELHRLIKSIVLDAFLVLTVPLVMDAPVAAIRFTSTPTYWPDVFPRFAFGLVRGEASRLAERVIEHGLAPTTLVAPCQLRARAAVLTREQWAVACQLGAPASARDLAAQRGTALIDMLECLGGLTRAGLCVPVRVSRRGQPSSSAPGRRGPAEVPAPPPSAGLPARRPAGDYPGRSAAAGPAPTADVLRQVLNGLRKLG